MPFDPDSSNLLSLSLVPPLPTEQERMIWLLCFLFKWKYYYIMPCFIYLEMESHRNPSLHHRALFLFLFLRPKMYCILVGSLTLEEWGLINPLVLVFHLSICLWVFFQQQTLSRLRDWFYWQNRFDISATFTNIFLHIDFFCIVPDSDFQS